MSTTLRRARKRREAFKARQQKAPANCAKDTATSAKLNALAVCANYETAQCNGHGYDVGPDGLCEKCREEKEKQDAGG
ncbi:MAG: hypothetical protein A3A33_01200 [Candidatus Yanofskybacteria bacterium RIFCSPLOWO2_01_FULL_49_25]|uniref:Uncharacterized protein n=1 Tax=Candidatus Yanofskybacteria bacterium RIFCSPLOWO2_01_FULL_49_25 TaxID=1802701 RepID=A0A1F8GWX3_9BACT|nr:MAG: hypothetical protein A3A33_01200 [Candidatus Yanofskybacteria bacterium RIFCSPLOWO2_01_FULL_49_25]